MNWFKKLQVRWLKFKIDGIQKGIADCEKKIEVWRTTAEKIYRAAQSMKPRNKELYVEEMNLASQCYRRTGRWHREKEILLDVEKELKARLKKLT